MIQQEEGTTSLKGHFLISMPNLSDPNFSSTVTCICVHNHEGAFGIVINRTLPGGTLRDVFKELGLPAVPETADHPVHIGGPVHPGHVFVLHGLPFTWDATIPVTDTIAMTNSPDILEAIAGGFGPRRFLVVLGCAGWGPGQLECEIVENSWLTCPASDDILFSAPLSDRWDRAARSLGIDPRLLSENSGHA
ncbi:MAG: YqgE/AlgH family protein [Deltaproteobacteria bacterium]|nr:YqgE/AlgH family protein [Deltaproteobacteria bacterium]